MYTLPKNFNSDSIVHMKYSDEAVRKVVDYNMQRDSDRGFSEAQCFIDDQYSEGWLVSFLLENGYISDVEYWEIEPQSSTMGILSYRWENSIYKTYENVKQFLSESSYEMPTDDELLFAVYYANAKAINDALKTKDSAYYNEDDAYFSGNPIEFFYHLMSSDGGYLANIDYESKRILNKVIDTINEEKNDYLQGLVETSADNFDSVLRQMVDEIENKWEERYSTLRNHINQKSSEYKLYTRKQAVMVMAIAYAKIIASRKDLDCILTDDEILESANDIYQSKYEASPVMS